MADSVKIKIGADASEYKKTLDGLGKVTKAGMADIKAGIDLATQAMQKFASVAEKGISYNAQLEQMQTSFEVMTGSAEKAAEVVERLRKMGAETPFETTDLVKTTQLLMQYGFTADEAIDRMSMLGDIAQGNAEKMNSVALGYAQMSSAGKVNLVDIKQMINAGFNPLREISERTGESMASLYDRISKGTISVDEITESMRAATSEGGKFFQSMEKQSQTLSGQLSTLKDNADQLLGSLTEGLSDELRSEILPLANDMIGQLQAAYEKGGTQGLKAAAVDMMRDLLGYLPTALRGASAAFPQITTAFFEVATLIATDLAAMFPELVPIIAEGLLNTAKAALEGTIKMLDGVIVASLEAFGVQFKKKVRDLSDLSDAGTVQTISAHIDGEFDTSDLDAEESELIGRIDTLYENVRKALTDGKPDTDEVLDPLRKEVEEVVQEAYADIDEWEKEQIAKLDPNAPDFETALNNITTKADDARVQVETYHTEMNNFIDDMAGKSATTVEANIGQIQTLTDELKRVVAEYGKSLRENSPEAYAYKAVTSGGATNEKTVGLAIDYVVADYKVNEANILQTKNEALQEAAKIAESDPAKALELEQQAEIKFQTDTAENVKNFRENAKSIIAGLGKTMTEEQRNALTKYTEWKSLEEGITQTMQQVMAGAVTGDLVDPSTIPDDVTLGIFELLKLGENPDAEIKAFADALNGKLDAATLGALVYAIQSRLQEQIQSSAEGTDTSLIASAWEALLGTDQVDAEWLLQGIDYEKTATEILTQASTSFASAAETADPWGMPVTFDMPIEEAADAGEEVGEAATEAMADPEGAADAGNESVGGLIGALEKAGYKAYNAGYNAGKQFEQGFKDAQDIASPSRVMMQMGMYSGEGLEKGLIESMTRAVLTAKRLSGQIVTAADMSTAMRVNFSGLQQEIVLANEQASTPVYLDGKQIAAIQGHNNSVQLAWDNNRSAKGVGRK